MWLEYRRATGQSAYPPVKETQVCNESVLQDAAATHTCFYPEAEVNHVLRFLSVAVFKYQLIHPCRGSLSLSESSGAVWNILRFSLKQHKSGPGWQGIGSRGGPLHKAISLQAFHEAHVRGIWISLGDFCDACAVTQSPSHGTRNEEQDPRAGLCTFEPPLCVDAGRC